MEDQAAVVNERLDAFEKSQAEASGECRLGRGAIAVLRPVLSADGLRWCCTHDEAEHCSAVVAPVEVK
jgi:hypothetical protein